MAEILKALADLLWPIIVLICVFLLRPLLKGVGNSKSIKIKVGEYELSLGDATANIASSVTDLQAKIAEISKRLDGAAPHTAAKAVSQEAATTLTSGEARNKKRILWVDDYPSNNAFLVERLRSSGYVIDISTTTKEALTKLASQSYALLITDLGRVEEGIDRPMAGRDLIKAVRGEDPDLPCLVFSSARAIQMADALRAAGATAVTSSGTDVIQFVETLMGGR